MRRRPDAGPAGRPPRALPETIGPRVRGALGPGTEEDPVVRRLISPDRPEDAVASYYARCHPGTRIAVRVEGGDAALLLTAEGGPGPVALIRATSPRLLPAVLESLPPGRRYLMAPWPLAGPLREILPIQEPERNRVFRPGPGGPVVPALRGGTLRLRSDRAAVVVEGAVASRCTLLWRSPRFAELSVATEPAHRGRGFARAAVAALAARLLGRGIVPLYIASLANPASLRVAAAAGFTPCPEDEFAGTVGGGAAAPA